jgi:hypothetical protein
MTCARKRRVSRRVCPSTMQFDDFLAVGRNLRLVLVPLHDEDLAVRKIAMCLLGRLGRLNPSYAMPTFRKPPYVPRASGRAAVARAPGQAIDRMVCMNARARAIPRLGLAGKILVQLLTQLEYNNEQTRKEEAVELLTSLIRSSHELVQPYATPIAQVGAWVISRATHSLTPSREQRARMLHSVGVFTACNQPVMLSAVCLCDGRRRA